jgi:hypothetical protein
MDYNCDHRPIFTTVSVAHKIKRRQFKRHVDWKGVEAKNNLHSSLGALSSAKIMHDGCLPSIQTLFEQVIDGAPNTRAKTVLENIPLSFGTLLLHFRNPAPARRLIRAPKSGWLEIIII